MNGVNTEVGKHRRQNRCADVHGAGVIQEHTKEDEQDVHTQKDHVAVAAHSVEQGLDHTVEVLDHEDTADHGNAEHHEAAHAGRAASLDEDLHTILEIDFLVNEKADKRRIEHGHSRRLRGRADAAINRAKYEDGEEQCRQGLPRHLGCMAQAFTLGHGGLNDDIGVLLELEVAPNAESNHHHDAGDHRGEEAGQQRLVGQPAEHEHHAAGWDKRAKHTGGCQQRRRYRRVVARLVHSGDHQLADDGFSRKGEARDRAENTAADGHHHCKATLDAAEQQIDEVYQVSLVL